MKDLERAIRLSKRDTNNRRQREETDYLKALAASELEALKTEAGDAQNGNCVPRQKITSVTPVYACLCLQRDVVAWCAVYVLTCVARPKGYSLGQAFATRFVYSLPLPLLTVALFLSCRDRLATHCVPLFCTRDTWRRLGTTLQMCLTARAHGGVMTTSSFQRQADHLRARTHCMAAWLAVCLNR